MPAERTPREDRSLLSRMLFWLTWLGMRQSHYVFVGAAALAVVAIVFAALSLNFRTSRLDLLNPNSEYNTRWLKYLNEFGDQDDVVVVVETNDSARSVAIVEELGQRLANDEDHFRSVMFKRDLSELRSKALHFAKPHELQRVSGFAKWASRAFGDSGVGVEAILATPPPTGRIEPNSGGEHPLAIIAENLHYALQGKEQVRPFLPIDADAERVSKEFEPSYFLAEEGRLAFLLLHIHSNGDSFTGGAEPIDALRNHMAEVQKKHPGSAIGATGMPVLENDEMRSSQNDMLRASVLSLAGVAILFVAGFGGVRRPTMAIIALLIAIAWSLGYITLAVGHLNILSVSFGVILIGLGIDFGIHYIARYQQLRQEGAGVSRSVLKTASSVGPGIVTGAVTTALAFLTAGLTDFPGIAELGVISGGGIILCLIAAIVVLPALIRRFDRGEGNEEPIATLPIGKVCGWLIAFPQPTLAVGLVATLLLAIGIVHLKVDNNLLNLQATGLQSVELERRILSKSSRSVWFALSVADSPEELHRKKQAFEKLSTVERTEEIGTLAVGISPHRSRQLEALRFQMLALAASLKPQSTTSAANISQKFTFAAERFPAQDKTKLALQRISHELTAAAPEVAARAIARVQRNMTAEMKIRFQELAAMADPEPPTLANFPQNMRDRFVGKTGKHLLRVYGRGEIWEMEKLKDFVQQVESVDPLVTGHPVQTYYSTAQMQDSYLHAALYSLLAVAVVLMIDFGSLRHTMLALTPMGLGFLQMLGIMGFFGIPLNPANMLVLPLILGIGIDDGVHVIHDYRRQKKKYRLGNATATAVVITSLTTMVGFGMMIFASHQGLRSLGQVLTIGVFCCLTTSVFILPAMLKWRRNLSLAEEPEPTAADSPTPENDARRLPKRIVIRSGKNSAA